MVADLYEQYIEYLDQGVPDGEAMTKLGCTRYCCRRMLMTHVDLIDKLLQYDPTKKKAAEGQNRQMDA